MADVPRDGSSPESPAAPARPAAPVERAATRSRLARLYGSTLGKKAIAAVTGGLLLAFLVLHVTGNLKAFLPDPSPGVADIDVYSRWLRSMGAPLLPHTGALWIVRGVLAVALVLHVVCVTQLVLHNRRARPVRYARIARVEATPAARWMLFTGVGLLGFLVFHLLQFTTGSVDAQRFVEGAVYANLYRAFQLWYYVALYLVALGALALHLHHGAWSLFQTLGLDNPDRNRGLRLLSAAVALGLFLTFASVPVAFFLGLLGPPSVSATADAVRAGY